MSGNTLKDLEARLKEVEKKQEAIDREREIRRIIKDQDMPIPAYLIEITKCMAAIIFILLAKDQALKINWVSELLK